MLGLLIVNSCYIKWAIDNNYFKNKKITSLTICVQPKWWAVTDHGDQVTKRQVSVGTYVAYRPNVLTTDSSCCRPKCPGKSPSQISWHLSTEHIFWVNHLLCTDDDAKLPTFSCCSTAMFICSSTCWFRRQQLVDFVVTFHQDISSHSWVTQITNAIITRPLLRLWQISLRLLLP